MAGRRTFGVVGAPWPRLGRLGLSVGRPVFGAVGRAAGLRGEDDPWSRSRGAVFAEALRRGETLHLLGLNAASHGAGVALVEASRDNGVRLVCNNEEERFSGVKHDASFPTRSIAALHDELDERGLGPGDLFACVAGWDFVRLAAHLGRWFVEDLPGSLAALRPRRTDVAPIPDLLGVLGAPRQLDRAFRRRAPLPIIGLRHHDNHARFAYAASPFAHQDAPTLVTVIDGTGDDGPISIYLARGGRVTMIQHTASIYDSLGALYALLSSTQGGWPPLSSEGRYMGAAAWGDGDRLTNRYYRRLRSIVHFGSEGRVRLNRAFVRWYRMGSPAIYGRELRDILGPPLLPAQMWNPDAVLSVDDVQHAPATRERVDKAAACQMVFEDALFHLVDHHLRRTGAERLVMAGGTALNCVAGMRLLDRFDGAWYARNLKRRDACLRLWVPPTPGDAGAAMGAAWNFAIQHGAPPGPPLQHAFWCGRAPTGAEIRAALAADADDPVDGIAVGEVRSPAGRERLADLLAWIVAHDGVMGLFQGRAETGPRALGHRSILANPCNPDTLALINARVKFREPFRPLAPMVTREAAEALFELAPGAADDDYNAYRYMVLTVPARPAARARVPAVVHHDGSARIQIVRRETDPFTHAYLCAMGRRVGVEVSVNTSLNVGSPICQTPAHALETLRRARGLDGLLLIGAEGDAWLAWHAVERGAKDAGRRLRGWLKAWQAEAARGAG